MICHAIQAVETRWALTGCKYGFAAFPCIYRARARGAVAPDIQGCTWAHMSSQSLVKDIYYMVCICNHDDVHILSMCECVITHCVATPQSVRSVELKSSCQEMTYSVYSYWLHMHPVWIPCGYPITGYANIRMVPILIPRNRYIA